jgi:hypothetical protein
MIDFQLVCALDNEDGFTCADDAQIEYSSWDVEQRTGNKPEKERTPDYTSVYSSESRW